MHRQPIGGVSSDPKALSRPPAQVWLDPRLAVGHSRIQGRGLFATEDIPNGTTLIRLGGRIVSSAELDVLIAHAAAKPGSPYVDTITVYEDAHLVLPAGSKVHFGNHSCDPNAWHAGPYEIGARRNIRAGEEVTIDYATSSGAKDFSMECTCGTALCRAQVTSEDWRRPELQDRYWDHWVPALRDRIRRVVF